jgi:Bruton agammaglobulinemia tyrosine kinase
MQYLEANNVVHRDLALRNCLVTTQGTEDTRFLVKVGDLGMSKIVKDGKFKVDPSNTALAVKWWYVSVILL